MLRNSGLGLLCSLFLLPVSATTPQSKLQHPTAIKLNRIKGKLDPTRLPEGARGLGVDSKQIFDLVMQNTIQLTVVPVHFTTTLDSGGDIASHNCGVYLLPANGTVDFFEIVEGELPIQCWSIIAIRLERIDGDYPLIVLTGDVNSGNRTWQQPIVLRWDKLSGKYTMDRIDFK
jgi:hypothetical protein